MANGYWRFGDDNTIEFYNADADKYQYLLKKGGGELTASKTIKLDFKNPYALFQGDDVPPVNKRFGAEIHVDVLNQNLDAANIYILGGPNDDYNLAVVITCADYYFDNPNGTKYWAVSFDVYDKYLS